MVLGALLLALRGSPNANLQEIARVEADYAHYIAIERRIVQENQITVDDELYVVSREELFSFSRAWHAFAYAIHNAERKNENVDVAIYNEVVKIASRMAVKSIAETVFSESIVSPVSPKTKKLRHARRNFTVPVSEMAKILKTSPETLRRRINKNPELERYMCEPVILTCIKAVESWWQTYEKNAAIAAKEAREMNKAFGGLKTT